MLIPYRQDDALKLEKKRERNRIAATKCRQRKLEKISTLGESSQRFEVDSGSCGRHMRVSKAFVIELAFSNFPEKEVALLKSENESLKNHGNRLSKEVRKLKDELDFHLANGCAVVDNFHIKNDNDHLNDGNGIDDEDEGDTKPDLTVHMQL